jgi:hypothetical protein
MRIAPYPAIRDVRLVGIESKAGHSAPPSVKICYVLDDSTPYTFCSVKLGKGFKVLSYNPQWYFNQPNESVKLQQRVDETWVSVTDEPVMEEPFGYKVPTDPNYARALITTRRIAPNSFALPIDLDDENNLDLETLQLKNSRESSQFYYEMTDCERGPHASLEYSRAQAHCHNVQPNDQVISEEYMAAKSLFNPQDDYSTQQGNIRIPNRGPNDVQQDEDDGLSGHRIDETFPSPTRTDSPFHFHVETTLSYNDLLSEFNTVGNNVFLTGEDREDRFFMFIVDKISGYRSKVSLSKLLGEIAMDPDLKQRIRDHFEDDPQEAGVQTIPSPDSGNYPLINQSRNQSQIPRNQTAIIEQIDQCTEHVGGEVDYLERFLEENNFHDIEGQSPFFTELMKESSYTW